MSNKIIAIAGLRNSGKDTASDMMLYLLNTPKILHTYFFYKIFKPIFKSNNFTKVSFATPLKEVLSIILGINVKRFEDRDFKENYYVNLNTLTVTKTPYNKISDNLFNRFAKTLDNNFTKNYEISIRQLMQFVGTNVLRSFLSDTLWINSTLRKPGNKVISDLRFKIEYDIIKDKKGKIIYINRNSAVPGNHASEREVYDLYKNNKFDNIISNNGTLKELFDNLKTII